jgi:eukaryotic-like serine/threonine-protein kinase
VSFSVAQSRRVLTLLGFIVAAAAAGYLVTCAIFPAPLLPKSVLVPAFRGMPADSALARLERLGLRGKLADTVSDPLTPNGTVAWQSPVAETALPQGAVVRLGISGGAPLVSMPDVADLDLVTARLVLEAAGLRVGQIDTVKAASDPGAVLATIPLFGATLHSGEQVRLTVSGGPLWEKR